MAAGVFAPLNIAAYVTWLALCGPLLVRLLRQDAPWSPLQLAGLAAILGWLFLFVASSRTPNNQPEPRWSRMGIVAQGLLAIGAMEAFPREFSLPVLVVIVAAELVMCFSLRGTIAWLAVFNPLLFAMMWRHYGAENATLSFLSFGGFQAFAVLCGHYAKSAFEARDRLSEVNAHLLSTRELLEESTRSHERLKLSRELHDVAGHKLTALKLNLARILRSPDATHREDLAMLARLADELLGDIRAVVGELRRHDGIDLGDALETLSRYVDMPRVHVVVAPDAKVGDLPSAEALLRCAQEALTNAVRHSGASDVWLRLERDGGRVRLDVSDNGRGEVPLRFGNGLTGMR
ncbi:MAG TPA: histidine kinase, partial [Xanthomonadales bacterium]|nr:histidine kinase [Xanthomonadales bacterium]